LYAFYLLQRDIWGCLESDPEPPKWMLRGKFRRRVSLFSPRSASESYGTTQNARRAPTVTVIGKAFFDIGHAPADHSNRRTDLQGYAAWEIHPVMKLDVKSD